ncbi:hypothetical protein [Paraburkholderia sp. BL23I1N1]|uniref:hypothetical protein n=1 Tax=Paraburkholderia sp. BL23I1N1 TaxID=1938802 RepID=UPI00160372BA|nr:hypothetical protein [Paraburkholderia sp. BL23I1N1]
MKLLDNTVPVLLFVMISARVAVVHTVAHRVIKQDSDLARRRGHGLGIPDPAGKASVECAKRGIASSGSGANGWSGRDFSNRYGYLID